MKRTSLVSDVPSKRPKLMTETVNLTDEEFSNISHLNTCSIDNIISLISLSQEMIENARKLSGISLSPDAEQFLSLIYLRQFDELRDFVARLLDISLTYFVVVPKVDFYGSESKIIELLRKFNISNHHYSVTLQCYNCCASFTNVTQIGSITEYLLYKKALTTK